jgi:hypothetical protein
MGELLNCGRTPMAACVLAQCVFSISLITADYRN